MAFGRYRLVSLIGEGGMGKVYKAHDTVIGRDVAIKVLHAEMASEPGYAERFRREAYTAARLTEPHIIPVHDTGEVDGHLFLVMPIIHGTDLHTLLRQNGPMAPEQAVRVIEQLAAALNAAHLSGLVHRDIKPSNALVTADHFVYLIDFGIAHDGAATKLTRTGAWVGTMAYMAPERFSAGTADPRGDVYALACVLHECLTGAQPFPGDSVEQQVAAHLTQSPPRPSGVNPAVPAGFDAVIAAGMAKQPEDRQQSALELAAAARRALTELPAAPPVPTPPAHAAAPGPATPWPSGAPAAPPRYPGAPPQAYPPQAYPPQHYAPQQFAQQPHAPAPLAQPPYPQQPYPQQPQYLAPGPPGPGPGPGPGGPYPPQFFPPQQPKAPRQNPFAGVPGSDFALDGATVVALLATLFLPWTIAESGYSRPEVIICLLLGLAALTVSHLGRTGIFGPARASARRRMTKLLLAAPLGLCAATYFVTDAIVGGMDGGPSVFAPAPGAWIAVAASVLAALPRRADLIDVGPQGGARRWGTALSATAIALLVFAVLTVLGVAWRTYRSLTDVFELRSLIALPLTQTVILAVWVIALWRVAQRAAGSAAEHVAARLVLAAAGAGALVWTCLAAVGSFTLGAAESLYLPFAGVALTMIAALVATSPPLLQPGQLPDAQTWLTAARGTFVLMIVADLALVAQTIANVTLTGTLGAVVIIAVIGSGVAAIAADWARQQIARNGSRCRGPVLIAAAVQAVTGVVTTLTVGLSAASWDVVSAPQVIAALALPAAAALFVTVPKPVRSFFPKAAPAAAPYPSAAYPSDPAAPADPAPSGPAATAADPATPAYVLYTLAQQYPALGPQIAGNPAAPQDLLNWLSQSTDPNVHAALRARQS